MLKVAGGMEERRLITAFPVYLPGSEKDGGKGMDRAVKKNIASFFSLVLKTPVSENMDPKRTEKLPGAEIQKPFKQSF